MPRSEKLLGGNELPLVVSVQGYQRGVVFYAEFYSTTDRTIKRWKAVARKAGKRLPPLDDPVDMVVWWGEVMSHKVPDKLLVRAEEVIGDVVDDIDAVDDDEEVFRDAVNLGEVEVVGDMGLDTMRRVVGVRISAVAAAYQSGKESDITGAERRFEGAVKTLRMLEKTQADMAKAGGDLVSKTWVRAELGPMLMQLSSSVLEAMIRGGEKLSPGLSREEALEAFTPERDKCFRVLRGELVG